MVLCCERTRGIGYSAPLQEAEAVCVAQKELWERRAERYSRQFMGVVLGSCLTATHVKIRKSLAWIAYVSSIATETRVRF